MNSQIVKLKKNGKREFSIRIRKGKKIRGISKEKVINWIITKFERIINYGNRRSS